MMKKTELIQRIIASLSEELAIIKEGARDAYEEATTTGARAGAVMFGDEMIDEASRKVALKLQSRGERAGLVRSA